MLRCALNVCPSVCISYTLIKVCFNLLLESGYQSLVPSKDIGWRMRTLPRPSSHAILTTTLTLTLVNSSLGTRGK